MTRFRPRRPGWSLLLCLLGPAGSAVDSATPVEVSDQPPAVASTGATNPAPAVRDFVAMARGVAIGADEKSLIAALGVPFEIIPIAYDDADLNLRLGSDRFFLYHHPTSTADLVVGIKDGICVSVMIWSNDGDADGASGDHLMTLDEYLVKITTRPHG